MLCIAYETIIGIPPRNGAAQLSQPGHHPPLQTSLLCVQQNVHRREQQKFLRWCEQSTH